MNYLRRRWIDDPKFIELSKIILDSTHRPNDGRTQKSWFDELNRVSHPVYDDAPDLRGLFWENLQVEESGPSGCNIDDGFFHRCVFNGTAFQSVSAKNCDFSDSRFIVAQMSPFYGPGSNFNNCQFKSCFAQGVGPRHHTNSEGVPTKGTYSDFRDCNFTNAIAEKTGFDRCDFRNADFTGASFEGCIFSESDLRGVKFGNTQFLRCDLRMAMVDDIPEWRNALELHGNLEVDTIAWC